MTLQHSSQSQCAHESGWVRSKHILGVVVLFSGDCKSVYACWCVCVHVSQCRSWKLTLINNLSAVWQVCVGRHKYTQIHTRTITFIFRHTQGNKVNYCHTHTNMTFPYCFRYRAVSFHMQYTCKSSLLPQLFVPHIFHGALQLSLLCTPPLFSPLI